MNDAKIEPTVVKFCAIMNSESIETFLMLVPETEKDCWRGNQQAIDTGKAAAQQLSKSSRGNSSDSMGEDHRGKSSAQIERTMQNLHHAGFSTKSCSFEMAARWLSVSIYKSWLNNWRQSRTKRRAVQEAVQIIITDGEVKAVARKATNDDLTRWSAQRIKTNAFLWSSICFYWAILTGVLSSSR